MNLYLNYTDIHYQYPGKFTPPAWSKKDLRAALRKSEKEKNKPLINVAEYKDCIKIEMAAPGLSREDFVVFIKDLELTVFVPKIEAARKEQATYQSHEFTYTSFYRKIVLPENVDTYFTKCIYEAGILKIYFPKSGGTSNKWSGQLFVY